jgi:endo-1,3-1,4-beta-glycanase ExoK
MGAYCEEMRPLKGYIKHCISKNNLKTNFKGSFMNMNRFVLYCLGFTLLIDLTGMAKDYNGAELYSNNTVKYGRFDIRMRTISGNATVSSFFLYYNNSYVGSPEPWQEIDIETLGNHNNIFQSNIITGTAANKITSEKVHTFDNLSQNYHTYTVEWTPDYIAWLFDGSEIQRSTGSQVTACQVKEMTYRFNAWISSNVGWVGQFDPSILPVYQFINWVKYSKYTPGSGTNGIDFTPEWQDDFDTFNSSRWSKGDWTFDANLVDFSPNNIVVKDGYCIICLTKTGATGFSGTVPKDQSTAIADFKKNSGGNFSPTRYPNPRTTLLVSLNGRLIPQPSVSSIKVNTSVWIIKENNTIMKKIALSK